MKKALIIIISAMLFFSSCDSRKNDNKSTEKTSSVENKDEFVKSLDYKNFVKKVWDIEHYPDSFTYRGTVPCIIDFYADWCGPCRKVAPIMEEIAQEYDGKLIVYKVNVDNESKLPLIFEIKNIPTVFFLPTEGQPFSQIGALSKEEYISIINKHLVN